MDGMTSPAVSKPPDPAPWATRRLTAGDTPRSTQVAVCTGIVVYSLRLREYRQGPLTESTHCMKLLPATEADRGRVYLQLSAG